MESPNDTPPKKKRGRPSKALAATVAAICANLEIAMPIKLAARCEGVGETTIHDWIRKGEAGEVPYDQISDAITRASAKAAKNLTVIALRGGKGSSSAQFLLERRFREDYGREVRMVHQSEGEGAGSKNGGGSGSSESPRRFILTTPQEQRERESPG